MQSSLTIPHQYNTLKLPSDSMKYYEDGSLHIVETESLNASPSKSVISVITKNALFLSALSRCLDSQFEDFAIQAFDGVDEWQKAPQRELTTIILLCATGHGTGDPSVVQNLEAIADIAPQARTLVIADDESPAAMIDALKHGAKGYVPMSLDLDVAIGAIKLVNVGGTFVPASGLLSMRTQGTAPVETDDVHSAEELLTRRQLTVLEYLRKGDPNKIIAYKLNMSEATVKIHVRNMMRKIRARNRTELVNLTKHLF